MENPKKEEKEEGEKKETKRETDGDEAERGERLADRAETFREDEGIQSESDRLRVLERGMIKDRAAGFWWKWDLGWWRCG